MAIERLQDSRVDPTRPTELNPALTGRRPTDIPLRRRRPLPPALLTPDPAARRQTALGDNSTPFQFPDEPKPVLIDPVDAIILTALRPLTEYDQPPHLVPAQQVRALVADLPEPRSQRHSSRRRKLVANFISDTKQRLPRGYGMVLVSGGSEYYFVEKRPEPQAQVLAIGEHLITDKGRLTLKLAEHALFERFNNGVLAEVASAEEIATLNQLLEGATDVADAIELRTAASGQEFYDLTRARVTYNRLYEPLRPRYLRGLQAFLAAEQDGGSSETIIQAVTSPDEAPDAQMTLRDLHDAVSLLFNRTTMNILRENPIEDEPTEMEVSRQLLAYMQERELAPVQLLTNIGRRLGTDSSRLLQRTSRRLLPPHGTLLKATLEAAPLLPRYEPHTPAVGTTQGKLAETGGPPPEQEFDPDLPFMYIDWQQDKALVVITYTGDTSKPARKLEVTNKIRRGVLEYMSARPGDELRNRIIAENVPDLPPEKASIEILAFRKHLEAWLKPGTLFKKSWTEEGLCFKMTANVIIGPIPQDILDMAEAVHGVPTRSRSGKHRRAQMRDLPSWE